MTAAHGSYKNMLNTHAFLRLSDQATCEDLVQKTFMKTWCYLSKGGKVDLMKAFLYNVNFNRTIKKNSRRPSVSCFKKTQTTLQRTKRKIKKASNKFRRLVV